MDLSALVVAQFTDIFRLGLLAGLIYTTERTRQQTGVLLPLVAGVVYLPGFLIQVLQLML